MRAGGVLAAALLLFTAGAPDNAAARAPAIHRHNAIFDGRAGSIRHQRETLSVAIERALLQEPRPNGVDADNWRRVQRMYVASNYAPIWIDSTGRGLRSRSRAASLIRALSRASEHALQVDPQLADALLLAVGTVSAGGVDSLTIAARADVLLSTTLVAYAMDLLNGQIDPRSVNRRWYIDPHTVGIDSVIARVFSEERLAESLAALRPQDPDYDVLMRELARYRELVASGGWPQVPALGVLRPGDTTTAGPLGALLGRLHAEGYLPVVALEPAYSTPTPERSDSGVARGVGAAVRYDKILTSAVASYQERHGLVVDSVVGPATLASLNRPADFRARQLAANLERQRWLPRARGARFIAVNIPAFRLRAFDAGREVLSMKVVVGAEYRGRATPAFSDSMSYVVFRPYWNVPQDIARRELWPKQRRDPSYFSRNGFEVVRASWGTYVREKPSPDNALGRVKFIFPNEHAIYLHDTPAQALFTEQVRAFSHGCIRVEQPDQLAEFVLGAQGWDIDTVRAAMSSGADNRRVNLDRTLPVYIVYFTTFQRDGTLHFGNDIYDRDDALVRALGSAAVPAERARLVDVRLRALARALDAGPATEG